MYIWNVVHQLSKGGGTVIPETDKLTYISTNYYVKEARESPLYISLFWLNNVELGAYTFNT